MHIRDKKSLTPALWKEVERIFLSALDLPTDQRMSFLDDACHGQQTLRDEVDSLLAAHIETIGVLDDFDAERAADLLRAALPEDAAIGAYKIVREIGRGGMGAVHEAERADGQFEQRVAIKVIKGGLDSEQIVQRFLNERQILARLQHPNIARLLDGGINEAGQPYFVMEYIDGQSILEFCDRQSLTIDERIQLFLQVCDAVHYAHRNLVVHRDLKPSNILVTPNGQVKLLDFGIAKMLATDEEVEAFVTETGVKAMTPEYASPEQVKGEAITTSTDVYALGVILFELLVGRRPYLFDRGSMQEMVRVICEQEPTRPTQALRERLQHSVGLTALEATRATPLSKLQRQFAGDLESILMKTLRKEPDQRFGSVQAFADDLKRYLAGEPVSSRAGSFGYVLKKFVRRHKGAVAAFLVIAMLLTAFSVNTKLQANRLAEERDKSAREAEKALLIADFLENIFRSSEPDVASGNTITARDLLSDSEARLRNDYKENPEAQALLTQVLGRTHFNMRFYERGEVLLREAIEKSTALEGAQSLATASNQYYLARNLTFGEPEGWQEESENLLREALAIQESNNESSHTIVKTLFALGHVLHKAGNREAAKEIAYRTLSVFEQGFDFTDAEALGNIYQTALMLRMAGEPDEAVSVYQAAIDNIEPVDRSLTLRLADAYGALGNTYLAQQKYIEAEEVLLQAFELKKSIADIEKILLYSAQGFYARALSYNGKHSEAIALQHEIHGYWTSTDSDIEQRALAEQELGRFYSLSGDYEEASKWTFSALQLQKSVFGPTNFRVAISERNLAKIYQAQGLYTEALEAVDRSIQIFTDNFGPAYTLVIRVQVIKAGILLENNRLQEAIDVLNGLWPIYEEKMKPVPSNSADAIVLLSRAYRMQNDIGRSDSLLRENIDFFSNNFGEDASQTLALKEELDGE